MVRLNLGFCLLRDRSGLLDDDPEAIASAWSSSTEDEADVDSRKPKRPDGV